MVGEADDGTGDREMHSKIDHGDRELSESMHVA